MDFSVSIWAHLVDRGKLCMNEQIRQETEKQIEQQTGWQPEQQIKQQLETLNQQIKELTGIYHQAAARLGISDNEFWVWYTLFVMGEEYSQQDICEMWSLPKQTVNSAVANMVKKKFVKLEAVPGTRNRKLLRLTDSGKSYVEGIVQPVFAAEYRTFVRLSEQERQICISLLGKYIGCFREELRELAALE